MCGIVGVAGNLGVVDENIFKTMLVLNQLRGHHSTGAVFVGKKASEGQQTSVTVCKELGSPNEKFFNSSVFKAKMTKINRIIIGHGRHATSGAADKIENAHPFRYFNKKSNNYYTGVHNGTLLSQANLLNHEDFEVDSENIYYDMAAEDDSTKTLEKLNGAYALVWFETKTQKLHMARNSQRPLFYRFSQNKKVVFWASEPWMIEIAAKRSKTTYPLDAKTHTVEINNKYTFDIPLYKAITTLDDPAKEAYTPYARVISPPANSLYGRDYDYDYGYGYWNQQRGSRPPLVDRVKSGSCTKVVNGKKEIKPTEKDVKTVEDLRGWNFTSGKRYKCRWENWGCGTTTQQQWDERLKKYKVRLNTNNKPITRVVYARADGEAPIPFSEVKKLFKDGCMWCSQTLEYGDTAYIYEHDMVLCSECEGHHEISGMGLEPKAPYGNYSDVIYAN